MNRVCFISVYFGKIPDFLRMFLNSCEWNKNFSFLLACDNDILFEIPSNVHVLKYDLDQFKKDVRSKVGIEVNDIKPYKLCDYRPAFGEIFKRYLKNYEFWGIVDTDIVLGNLNKFITNELLNEYDKIFTMGHLSIVRNTDECNRIYRQNTYNSRNYKKVFENPTSCVYDEYEGFTEKFVDEGYKVYKKRVCADIHELAGRIEIADRFFFKLIQPRNNYINYCKDRNFKHECFVLDKGRIYQLYIEKGKKIQKREYAYAHKLEFVYDEGLDVNKRLIITKRGYVSDEDFFKCLDAETLSSSDMDKYNKKNYFLEWMICAYLYVRLNIRKYRKRFFPRINEM